MSDNDKMREDYDRLAKLAEKQYARIKELEGMVAMQAAALKEANSKMQGAGYAAMMRRLADTRRATSKKG